MKYKAILFDLDGTLLPMDYDSFLRAYLGKLYSVLSKKYDLDLKSFSAALLKATDDMTNNDGSLTNEDVFWLNFEKILNVKKEMLNDDCLKFYTKEFHELKAVTGDNPLARIAVDYAREKAEYVILATNPLFPEVAQLSRMSWVNLNKEDFDLITHYSSDIYCKPNTKYYEDILKKFDLKPEECLMIGNNEEEDMYSAKTLGMDTFLVDDCLIESYEHPYNGNRGSFRELVRMLEKL